MSTRGLFIIGLIVVLAALIFINNRPPAEEVSPAGETAAAQVKESYKRENRLGFSVPVPANLCGAEKVF